MTAISNTDDSIDSRDICERINQLETDMAAEGEYTAEQRAEFREELETLQKLVDQINNYSDDDAEDGVTLIRDSHFEDYAQELAEDCGMVKKDIAWPIPALTGNRLHGNCRWIIPVLNLTALLIGRGRISLPGS